jgi:hypothetical protein
LRERQRVKSWTARTELRRAPMEEVTRTIDLFQRGMMIEGMKRGVKDRRDE